VVLHPSAGSGNRIQKNLMTGNNFGIDLGWNGPTANDALDADAGPNDLVNKPELLAALYTGSSTHVGVRLNAAPSTVYQVEFFQSATCHGSGYGEGNFPVLIDTTTATDGSGQLVFSVTLPPYVSGVITATATDPSGSTSEFSACESIATVPAGVFYWAPSSGGNGHFYQYVTGGETWTQAKTAAEALSVLGQAGHLVTITSVAEQAFVNSIRISLGLGDWRPWIGLHDPAGTGTWTWVTAEPLAYTNWSGGEPNNIGTERWVEIFASGVWNNIIDSPITPLGWLVEYDVP